MELAGHSRAADASSGSASAAFTRRWQSSKEPATSSACTLPPNAVSCCSCRRLMRPDGYSSTTSMPLRRQKARATAPPVSPEVATSTTTRCPPGLARSRRSSSVARNEAPKSLNAQVGPWKSSSRTMPSCSRLRAGANGKAASTRHSAAAAGPLGGPASSSSSNRDVAAAATSRNAAPSGRAEISCPRSGAESG